MSPGSVFWGPMLLVLLSNSGVLTTSRWWQLNAILICGLDINKECRSCRPVVLEMSGCRPFTAEPLFQPASAPVSQAAYSYAIDELSGSYAIDELSGFATIIFDSIYWWLWLWLGSAYELSAARSNRIVVANWLAWFSVCFPLVLNYLINYHGVRNR